MVYKSQCLDVFSKLEAYSPGKNRRHDTLRTEYPHPSLEYIFNEVEIVVASHDDVCRVWNRVSIRKSDGIFIFSFLSLPSSLPLPSSLARLIWDRFRLGGISTLPPAASITRRSCFQCGLILGVKKKDLPWNDGGLLQSSSFPWTYVKGICRNYN